MDMRYPLLLACGLLAAGGAQAAGQGGLQAGAPRVASAQNESAERDIRAAIGHYFQGHATGDPSHFRKVFLPTAHVETIRDGEFTSWTLDEYCAFFKGPPPGDESKRVRRVDFVDVSNDAAIVKVTLDYPKIVFTDYFLMLNVGGGWKIANKVATNRKKGS